MAGEDLDARAADAYRLLQAGQAAEAVDAIAAIVDLAVARPALQARLHAWAAQGHLMLRDASAARRQLSKALRIARRESDAAALKALAPVQEQVMAALTAKAAQAAGPPDTPVGRAVAAYDAGDPVEGERLARVALDEARAACDAREEVLAWLALARSEAHTTTAIDAAAEVADRSGDFNLVTAVARAARAAGHTLAPKVF